MKKTITTIDEILDQYLDGLITEEEMRDMHLQLENKHKDEDIDALLEKIELPVDILVAPNTRKVLPNQIFTTPLEPINARERFLHQLPYWVVLLITIAMLLVAYRMFYHSHLVMAEQYFKPYAISTIERSFVSDEQKKEWDKAVFAYETPNYIAATTHFKNILNQQPKNDFIDSFFTGICHLALRQPREAIVYLNKSTEGGNMAWKNTAYWYLGLAYLSNENILVARQYLEKVALADSHIHKNDAIEILQKIK
jgi:tetratricopeptide (TPR) repeat protein